MSDPVVPPTVQDADYIRAAAVRLAEAQLASDRLKAQLDERKALFAADNAKLLDDLRVVGDLEDQLETEVRSLAEARFSATGEKAICPGVSVKMMTKVSVDPVAGLAWVVDRKFEELLIPAQLNVAAAGKMARAGVALPFVKLSEVPQALLDSDLPKALGLVVPAVVA